MKKYYYTTAEFELIDEMYDEQYSLKTIADECNKFFHNGNLVRTENSINYAISKMLNDPRCLDLRMYSDEGK